MFQSIDKIVLLVFMQFLLSVDAFAVTPINTKIPSIQNDAVEIGFSGSLTAVDRASNVSVSIHGGKFYPLFEGLAEPELSISYSHIRSLDVIDLQALFSWHTFWQNSVVYPFWSIGGGLRQEWLGSFQDVRYLMGFNTGIKVLFSNFSAMRIEYILRRVMDDPIANFTEHKLTIGISVLLKN